MENEKSKAIELLEETILAQEDKIEKMQETIEIYEEGKSWMVHRIVNEKEVAEQYKGYDKLPLPRLEMRINPLSKDWYQIEWIYGMVYKHYSDTLIDNHEVMFIPMGRTTGRGELFQQMKEGTGKIELPRRDGHHIRTEMKMLGLYGVVLCNGRLEYIGKGGLTTEFLDSTKEKMVRKVSTGKKLKEENKDESDSKG